jgi:hypothetical protein
MNLLKLLLRKRDDDVARLASEIAQRSFDGVWKRLSPAVASMPPQEARGYVRARAAAVVQAEVARLDPRQVGEPAALVERAHGAVLAAVEQELRARKPGGNVQRRAA